MDQNEIRIVQKYRPINYVIIIFLIILLGLIIILGYKYFNLKKENEVINNKNKDKNNDNKENEVPQQIIVNPNPRTEVVIDTTPDNSNFNDIIKEYDYRKSFDLLEDPRRRISRYQIPPYHLKRMIDIPTQGYPDNFRQIGYLSSSSASDDTKILRLFGREEIPRSNRWEYYTAISSGNDLIKIPIERKHGQELYDDDKITVLDNEYTVKIYELDAPRYYPDIF